MEALKDNSIWFRHRLQSQKTRPWRKAWWSYFVLVILPPLLLGAGIRSLQPSTTELGWLMLYLTCFLHVFYFSASTLSRTITTVAQEKERKTFDSLRCTRLTPADILLGQATTLLLPAMAQATVFGLSIAIIHEHFVLTQWLQLSLMSCALVLGFGGLGMAVSHRHDSALKAGQTGFGLLGFTFLLTAWGDALYFESMLEPAELGSCTFLNPLVGVAHLLDPHSSGPWEGNWALLSLTYAVLGLLFLFWFYRRCQSNDTVRVRPRRAPLLPDMFGETNPVLYRELRLSSSFWVYPLLLLSPILYGVYTNPQPSFQSCNNRGDDFFAVAVFLHLLYFTLKAAFSAVSAFAVEREKRTLDSLLATRISSRELYRGKLLAVVLPLCFEMLLGSPILLWFVVIGQVDVLTMAGLVTITLVDIVFLAALGLLASARFERSARAGQFMIAFIGLTFLGSVVIDICLSIARPYGGDVFIASALSPLMAFLTMLWEQSETGVWLVHLVLYSAAAVGLMKTTPRLLERR